MPQPHIKKVIFIIILITAGLLLQLTGVVDAGQLLNIARDYADQWWLVALLIFLQMIMFTFALAGTIFLWVAAPLYPPAMATFILVAGATFGGISAYLFSKRLTDDWVAKIEKSKVYKLLHTQDNIFVLFALRVFPAFPHAFVNYSSGILAVNLIPFIIATILGIGIKSYIYARVIYSATETASIDTLFNISTYGPLIALSLITLIGVYVNYKISIKDK